MTLEEAAESFRKAIAVLDEAKKVMDDAQEALVAARLKHQKAGDEALRCRGDLLAMAAGEPDVVVTRRHLD